MTTDDYLWLLKSSLDNSDYEKLEGIMVTLKEDVQLSYVSRLYYISSNFFGSGYEYCFTSGASIDYSMLMDGLLNKEFGGEAVASSETGVLDADPSLSGAMHYEGDFGGNVIYYDEARTCEAIICIRNCCAHIDTFLGKVSEASKPFADIGRPYDKLVSSMSSFDYSRLSEDLEAAQTKCLTEIKRVVDAISDYADGDGISNESIGILNEWIKKSPTAITPFGDDPNSGPGAAPTIEPIFGEDNPDLNKEPENPTDSDDILVLPGNSGNGIINHGSTGSAILGGVGAGASLLADDNLSDASSMDDIQTSLLGSLDSRFIVPSPKTTVGEIDGVKSSGAIGAVGAVIAAGAALGGKIYYDKKKESDQESNSEESEESALGSEDEQKNVDLEEIKTSDGEMDFRIDGVQFKENLFNLVGGENNE